MRFMKILALYECLDLADQFLSRKVVLQKKKQAREKSAEA